MSVSATSAAQLTVVRTSAGPGVSTSDNTVTLNLLNTSTALGAATTPAVTKDVCFNLTLSSGLGSIDLTALPDPDLGTVDFTGLRVQQMLLFNPTTNANDISVAKGASNGYTGLGSAYGETLAPGGYSVRCTNDRAPDIDSSHRILDVTGTGAQVLKVQITAG